MDGIQNLRRSDYVLLAGYCLLLFGVSLVAGRPLTLHESVLPQSAREMLADGDWIVPKKGGEPWLESPPLPQWCTVAIASLVGRCDAVWIVRIGPMLAATLSVCLTSWMAGRWYGRTLGLLSGFVLATTCEFTRYAWLAEDEIYLCALVTMAVAAFVSLEFRGNDRPERERPGKIIDPVSPHFGELTRIEGAGSFSPNVQGVFRLLFGSRPAAVVLFFVLLGMTNLAKGLIFGTAMAGIPMAVWLCWNRDWPRFTKYLWVWGAILFATIMLAWPVAAMWRSPDVVDVWKYDLGGRMSGEYTEINQPVWYYPVNLLWMLTPWTFVLPFGLAATWPAVKTVRNSPERFLWAWALGVPLVFSIPGGKHHHYLLHALAPWAILAALGLDHCRAWLTAWPRWLVHPVTGACTVGLPAVMAILLVQQRHPLPGPEGFWLGLMISLPFAAGLFTWGLHHRQPLTAAVTIFAMLWVVYAGGHWYSGQYVDVHRHDVQLLQEARRLQAERQAAIVVDLSRSPLSGFLELFYLPDQARAIHNISFLADERLPGEMLLLTRQGEVDAVRHWGAVTEVSRSTRPLKAKDEASRLTLLELRLNHNLVRLPAAAVQVTPMQAMQRAEGPVLR